MFKYRLSFDIKVQNSVNEIEILILGRNDIPAWKENKDNSEIKPYYNKNGLKINDVFKPTISDAYAFVINNRKSSISHEVKTVEVILTHNWKQEVKESQLKEHIKTQGQDFLDKQLLEFMICTANQTAQQNKSYYTETNPNELIVKPFWNFTRFQMNALLYIVHKRYDK